METLETTERSIINLKRQAKMEYYLERPEEYSVEEIPKGTYDSNQWTAKSIGAELVIRGAEKDIFIHEKPRAHKETRKTYTPEHIQKSLENLKLDPKPGPIEGYPKFDETKLSTRTYIIITNLNLANDFYNILPITEYVVVPKRRGRRKKVDTADPNADIPEGSIITIRPSDGSVIGVDLKAVGKTGKRGIFGNSITIVMIIDGKRLNFKVCLNGKFQMTGAKSLEQSEKCIKFFWNYLKDTSVYNLRGEYFEAYFRPVMCNVGFKLGFMINREKLNQCFIDNHPYYPSLWENSIGSAGANIKMPIANPDGVQVKKLRCVNGKWMGSFISWGKLKERFSVDKKKKNAKEEAKYTTFLVFHRGKVNMSSMDLSIMPEPYYRFMQIIKIFRKDVEEKLALE